MRIFLFTDIDECDTENNGGCQAPAFCVNLPGSFECRCPEEPADYVLVEGTVCERFVHSFALVFFDLPFYFVLMMIKFKYNLFRFCPIKRERPICNWCRQVLRGVFIFLWCHTVNVWLRLKFDGYLLCLMQTFLAERFCSARRHLSMSDWPKFSRTLGKNICHC